MNSRFGDCPNCGSEKLYASQSVCSICGHSFGPPAPVTPAGPAYPAAAPPPAYYAQPAVTPQRHSHFPFIGLAMVLVVVVLCGGLAAGYALMGPGKGGGADPSALAGESPAPTADNSSGSVTIAPQTISCSKDTSLAVTWRVWGSVARTDSVFLYVDRYSLRTSLDPQISVTFRREADGTWAYSRFFELGGCSRPIWNTPGYHVFRAQGEDQFTAGVLTITP